MPKRKFELLEEIDEGEVEMTTSLTMSDNALWEVAQRVDEALSSPASASPLKKYKRWGIRIWLDKDMSFSRLVSTLRDADLIHKKCIIKMYKTEEVSK